MKPFVTSGLIPGVIGLVVIIPILAVIGLDHWGLIIPILAGATAGILSAHAGKASTRRKGARSGAIAGAISGEIILIGYYIIMVLNNAHRSLPVYPRAYSYPIFVAAFYGGVIFGWLIMGIIVISLGVITGGIAGALGTRELPSPIIPASTPGGIQ